jgi:hypothetical protein
MASPHSNSSATNQAESRIEQEALFDVIPEIDNPASGQHVVPLQSVGPERIEVPISDPEQEALRQLVSEQGKNASSVALREADAGLAVEAKAETVPPPPGSRVHTADPYADSNGDGITDTARVGVPGNEVPETIWRMPNLTPGQREAETRFASAYEADPDGMAKQVIAKVVGEAGEDKAPVFETDAMKEFSADFGSKSEKRLNNLALHQTANALAKRAFSSYLGSMADDPEQAGGTVLITAGGVGAGKSYAIDKLAESDETMQQAVSSEVARFDAAGEACSSEVPWAIEQAKASGFKPVVVFVDRDPSKAMSEKVPDGDGENGFLHRGILPRSEMKGRMVDAYSIADSYTVGPRNFQAVADNYAEDEDVGIMIVNNDAKQPQLVAGIDPSHLAIEPKDLRAQVVGAIQDYGNQEMIESGVHTPQRVWGGDAQGEGAGPDIAADEARL